MNVLLAGIMGGWEMVLILAVVLILFGAKKLPELAKDAGQAIREFNKAKESEVTEAAETGQASPGGGSFVSMTVTAMAQVRPAAPCAATNTAPAAGQQAMRAIVATTKVTP